MAYEVQRYNPYAEQFSLTKVPFELRHSAEFPIGMPFLVHRETREIPVEPLAYMLDLCDVHIRRENGRFPLQTALTYIQPIKGWHELLDAEGIAFRHADDEAIQLWLSDALDYVIPHKGARYERSTLAQNIGNIVRCYERTNKLGLTDVTLDEDAALARAWGVDSMYDAEGKRLDMRNLDHARRHMIRVVDEATWNRIRGALLRPGDWSPRCGRSSRPWVDIHFGLYGGYRVVETTGVWAEDVMRITVADPKVEYEVPLHRTKGADGRSTLLRGQVIKDAQAYHRGERAASVARASELFGAAYDEPPELLVNGLASGEWIGRAAHASSIQRDFRRIQEKLGLTASVQGQDRDGAPRTYVLPLHCFHDLRHTHALAHYRIAYFRERDHAKALEIVRVRLGHAHRSTTEKIYLSPDRRLVASVGDVMSRQIGAMIRG